MRAYGIGAEHQYDCSSLSRVKQWYSTTILSYGYRLQARDKHDVDRHNTACSFLEVVWCMVGDFGQEAMMNDDASRKTHKLVCNTLAWLALTRCALR
jgi:hypothetical protein